MWTALRDYARRPAGAGKAPVGFAVENLTAATFDGAASTAIGVRWLGHASAVLELSGRRYLLDPMLSDRASMVSWAGPRRLHRSPVSAADLHGIDAVVISHDHYDHLDAPTIRVLARTVPRFIVAPGLATHLVRWGVAADRITELGWWQETQDGPVTIVAAPARHFSGRGPSAVLSQTYSTWWCSFAFIDGERRVYFGGDSGFMPQYEDIGRRLGPFDLTLMPIGAYHEAWADIHCNPEEALAAHRMVGGRVMLPIHWATFDLAPHSWHDPIDRLQAAVAVAAPSDRVSLLLPRPGAWVRPESPDAGGTDDNSTCRDIR